MDEWSSTCPTESRFTFQYTLQILTEVGWESQIEFTCMLHTGYKGVGWKVEFSMSKIIFDYYFNHYLRFSEGGGGKRS